MNSAARSYEATWFGQPALALETPLLRVVTVPNMGAKIVSLFDKQTGREWLLPPMGRDFKPAEYGASFVEQDMSGWDEIFPTTDACKYPVEGSYHGNYLPDHGEVWAVSWYVDNLAQDSISLSTTGRVLPYRLSRTVRLLDMQRMVVEFEVVNTGTDPFVALWAAHPQFAVDSDTRIVLPEHVDRVVNVHPTPDWPELLKEYIWPEDRASDGHEHRLDRIGSAELHSCRKFYALPAVSVSWAGLRHITTGAWIRMSWDTREIPYLGIWVDEGAYNPLPTAALEPTTGFFDKLDTAWQNNAVMRLQPNIPICWSLNIELGNGELPVSE